MERDRFHLRAAVNLILTRENCILLAGRYRTGWQDGMYGLVGGHLDGNETVTAALVREAKEETGIQIQPADVEVVHAMHWKSQNGLEYIDFFATAKRWIGEPTIMEADKCDDLRWFALSNLPDNTLASTKQALDAYARRVPFSEFGWDGETE